MHFVDTHVHLDDAAFDPDRDEVVAASRANGVVRWINVGYNERTWVSTVELAQETPGLSFMLGLHPGSTDEWSSATIPTLRELARRSAPVAIGEIGIDLYWRQDNLPAQIESFIAQLGLALELGLPAVIHMREADEALLDVLGSAEDLPHIHFHSFDGKEELRAWAIDHGATFGIGGLLTRAGSESLRDWVSDLPRDRVVLETDAPYLKPRGIRGQRNQPAYLLKTAELVARLWRIEVAEVAQITSANAERIFSNMKETDA